MRLTEQELKGMNNPFRQWLQRTFELPQFRRMGLRGTNQDILEIGCGSGYGAALLGTLKPRSYLGIDLMPEQIALAEKRGVPNTSFRVQDASDLHDIADASTDEIVIFGVLHHIPTWRAALAESFRVLRPSGRLFLEEPDGAAIAYWDRVFHWGHPTTFTLRALEIALTEIGFTLRDRRLLFVGFRSYCAEKPLNSVQ